MMKQLKLIDDELHQLSYVLILSSFLSQNSIKDQYLSTGAGLKSFLQKVIVIQNIHNEKTRKKHTRTNTVLVKALDLVDKCVSLCFVTFQYSYE